MTDKTGVVFFVTCFGMTFGTVIHFHAIGRLFIEIDTRDILSPYADGVTGDPILLICRDLLGVRMVSMAGVA